MSLGQDTFCEQISFNVAIIIISNQKNFYKVLMNLIIGISDLEYSHQHNAWEKRRA